MDSGIIGKFLSFWAFMLGVVIFGRLLGFLDDTRQSVFILIGAALIFAVWTVGRSMAKRRREEREYEESMRANAPRKGSGKEAGKTSGKGRKR